jgi:23S rRNA pseudouridine1911/1915/1917 synthase
MVFVKKYTCSKYSFEGKRLDKFLVDELKNFSRSQLQRMIKEEEIKVNGKTKKPGYVLTNADVVEIADVKKDQGTLNAEKVDVPILYEDKDVLVVNKPYGMIVHPVDGAKSMSGTLVNAILDKIKKDEFVNLRPGIVHRIDKDTSGALIIARNKKSYEHLIGQFKERRVDKTYLALVCGILEHPEGRIESPIGRAYVDRKRMRVTHESEGKVAISIYKTLKTFKLEHGRYSCSLLEVKIKTGRTHQIRVHMSALGSPVIGDSAYGNKKLNTLFEEKYALKRQFLHAYKLAFVSPATKKEVAVVADLPSDLENVITLLS